MHRSELTVDLGAVRRNARTLLRVLDGSQLWAVVKADAYGHGAVDVAGAVLDEGAGALCVATVAEGLELRAEFPLARILAMGPTSSSREVAEAREARFELAWSGRRATRGRACAPEARHRHGPLGAVGAARARPARWSA